MSETHLGYEVADILLIGEKQRKAVINRYNKHLTAYAKHWVLDTDDPKLWFIQQALLTAVHSRKLEDIYDQNMVFGAAVAIGRTNYRRPLIEGLKDLEMFNANTEETIIKTAEWLSGRQFSERRSWRRFFTPTPLPTYKKEVYTYHLKNIVQEWPVCWGGK